MKIPSVVPVSSSVPTTKIDPKYVKNFFLLPRLLLGKGEANHGPRRTHGHKELQRKAI